VIDHNCHDFRGHVPVIGGCCHAAYEVGEGRNGREGEPLWFGEDAPSVADMRFDCRHAPDRVRHLFAPRVGILGRDV